VTPSPPAQRAPMAAGASAAASGPAGPWGDRAPGMPADSTGSVPPGARRSAACQTSPRGWPSPYALAHHPDSAIRRGPHGPRPRGGALRRASARPGSGGGRPLSSSGSDARGHHRSGWSSAARAHGRSAPRALPGNSAGPGRPPRPRPGWVAGAERGAAPEGRS
jgi:hypothetical protein